MRALVVEDNESLRVLFQLFLQNMGFETDEAPDGSVGFKKIQKTDYDIILSDMDMPNVNGAELYQMIAAYSPRLVSRLLFTTGNGFGGRYEDFLKAVPCPVLFKPFLLVEFKEIVQLLLDRTRETNVLPNEAPGIHSLHA